MCTENSIRVDDGAESLKAGGMMTLPCFILAILALLFKSKIRLDLEERNFLRKESNCAVGESNYRVIRDQKNAGQSIGPQERPAVSAELPALRLARLLVLGHRTRCVTPIAFVVVHLISASNTP